MVRWLIWLAIKVSLFGRMRRLAKTNPNISDLSFSVVIPAFNAENTLAACLDSIIQCTEKTSEIIVVDDASTDRTAQIAASYPCHLVQNETNLGPGGTRNKGAQLVTGDWIVFIDSDVCIEPDTFEKIRAYIARHPEISSVSATYSAICPVNGFISKYKNHYLNQSFCWLSERVGFANTSLMAIKKQVFQQFGGFADEWKAAEDTIFGAELALSGHSLFVAKEICVQHMKQLTLARLLKDDFQRSYEMAKFLWTKMDKLPFMIRHCIGHHHSMGLMLRVPLSYLIFFLIIAFAFFPSSYMVAATGAVSALFLALMGPFLFRLAKAEGLGFTLLVIPLHWIEMLVGGAAVFIAFFAHRTKR